MNDKLAYEKNKRRIFMSKYEQAIKLLEMLSSDEFQQFTSSEFDDAIYTAIEALEKQIPKKPVDNPKTGWFECPNCGLIVWICYGTGETHHCDCGQRLDWEGIE